MFIFVSCCLYAETASSVEQTSEKANQLQVAEQKKIPVDGTSPRESEFSRKASFYDRQATGEMSLDDWKKYLGKFGDSYYSYAFFYPLIQGKFGSIAVYTHLRLLIIVAIQVCFKSLSNSNSHFAFCFQTCIQNKSKKLTCALRERASIACQQHLPDPSHDLEIRADWDDHVF